MGLVDIILAGLCLNCTNFEDVIDAGREKKIYLKNLGNELKGRHFRVTTIQNYPLSFVETQNGQLIGRGVAFDFLNILQEKLEFNYSIVLPEETNSNVSGVIGMLDSKKADLAFAFVTVMPSYWKYVRYSITLDIGQWVVLMRRPRESATGSGLLAPFSVSVWMLVLVSLVIVGPIIYFVIILQARLCKDDNCKIFPLPACIWFVYGALLKQGSTLAPMSDSSRLLFATWWIFITILTAFYTANLTAFLTLSRFTLDINSVSDIGTKKYSWVSDKDGPIEEVVQNELYNSNGLSGSNGKFVKGTSQEIFNNYVKKQNYIYIGERRMIEYLMYNDYIKISNPTISESEKCKFVITTWSIMNSPRAFAYSKDFSYHEVFDSLLEHLVEAGIVKYKLQEGLPNTQICPLNLGNKERQLRNSDLLMTYIIVGVGFILATIIFIVEVFMNHYGSKKDKRTFLEKQKEKFNNNYEGYGRYNNFMSQPPPPYSSLFRPPFYNNSDRVKKLINGREYWVIKSKLGETTLIPLRSPSAFIYQYTN